ncbi:CAP domain-containing protein [Sphingobacterium hotanense]|uniref:CAP domain-containing protein n=1 Tax=Sphingobacterium hotanense TaxID=649196 RepID=UPI0011F23F0D|nr:CAP domain-containing protein [Sphingobacterium hotanense]
MRYLLLAIALWVNPIFAQKNIKLDRSEAKKAYEYLNKIRSNPEKYRRALQISNIKQVTRTKLVWNKDLAKVAEYRAYDMANRNYFDHTNPEGIGPNYYIQKAGYDLNKDWLKRRSNNNFESIAANHASGVDAIEAFIIGHGSPGKMHRKHLLGMDQWNGSLKDVGIGFARVPRGSTYKTYICVIIAKHDW